MTEKHLIELKVMRLSLPTFSINPNIPPDDTDYCGNSLKRALTKFEYMDSSINMISCLHPLLKSIYLGETFKAYVTLHNLEKEEKIFNILLNIYIQTGTQKINIYSPDIIKEIEGVQNYDHIICHEIKELGSHVLVCEVNYTNKDSQILNFRKFFKFQVNKPLDVKTKFYNSETGEVFLETQVQNLTNNPIVLEQMSLFPHENYKVKDVNYDKNQNLIFNPINALNPLDTRQYLFCLFLKDKMIESKQTLSLTDVGKLHIAWRGPYGEKGALQTSQLHRLPSQIPDILLQTETMPDQVEVERVFTVTCRITNFSERSMDISFNLIDDFNKPQSLYWLGVMSKHIGKLEPDQHATLHLSLYATRPGFKSISGIRLLDTFLNRVYEYDNIGQVYIHTRRAPLNVIR